MPKLNHHIILEDTSGVWQWPPPLETLHDRQLIHISPSAPRRHHSSGEKGVGRNPAQSRIDSSNDQDRPRGPTQVYHVHNYINNVPCHHHQRGHNRDRSPQRQRSHAHTYHHHQHHRGRSRRLNQGHRLHTKDLNDSRTKWEWETRHRSRSRSRSPSNSRRCIQVISGYQPAVAAPLVRGRAPPPPVTKSMKPIFLTVDKTNVNDSIHALTEDMRNLNTAWDVYARLH